MQIENGKKGTTKCLKNWIWEGLGLHLGGGWGGLGRLLGTFGCFLTIFWRFWIHLFSSIGQGWGPGGLLDRFWIDFGGFWEGLGRILGGFGHNFDRFLQLFCKSGADLGHLWKYLTLLEIFQRIFYVRTPALSREASRSVPIKRKPWTAPAGVGAINNIRRILKHKRRLQDFKPRRPQDSCP